MQVETIYLDKIDSTNNFLKSLSLQSALLDFLTVTTEAQWRGRGQYGNSWNAKPGQNITCSIYRQIPSRLEVFLLMMSTSLALQRVLSGLVAHCCIKWPNDIFVRNKKISGILIEIVPKKECFSAIIGIGINVNQTDFKDLSQATSLKIITGKEYRLQDILTALVQEMQAENLSIDRNNYFYLKQQYETILYKKNKVHSFSDPLGNTFNGIIKGVSDKGLLQILLEDDRLMEYNIKQIRF